MSTLVITNQPFEESNWKSTEGFGSDRVTDALLNLPTHPVHILEINGGDLPPRAQSVERSFVPGIGRTGDFHLTPRLLQPSPDLPPSHTT